jgi:osmotically-inducible protein OsmY
MKTRYAIAAAAALAFTAGSAQAFHTEKGAIAPTNNIHGGAVTVEDQVLLDQVMTALATDRQLQQGVTATVVVKDGKVTMNGSADSLTQAARAEKLAKDAAGPGNVVGTLYPSGA